MSGKRWMLPAALALVALLAALPFAAGCGTKTTTESTTPGTTTGTKGTQSIQADVGESFNIVLESNASTGFQWVLAEQPDPKVVAFEGTHYDQHDLTPGAPGREILTFKGTGSGTTTFKLEYKQPWDTTTAPAKTETVTVKVNPGSKQPPKVVTDNSEPIKIGVGDDFIIQLESNATTGYVWQIAKGYDKTVVQFEGSEYVAPAADSPMGAPGTERWRFEGLKIGSTEIVLKYVQPWDKNAKPAQELTFTVNVF